MNKNDIEDAVLLILVQAKLIMLSYTPGFVGGCPLGVIGRLPSVPVESWAVNCYDQKPFTDPNDPNLTSIASYVQIRVRSAGPITDQYDQLDSALQVTNHPVMGHKLSGKRISFADLGPDEAGNFETTINYQFIS